MDEVLKARKLTSEILQKANAIQAHMQSVNASMRNMELMEQQSSQKAPAVAAPSLSLMDLPDDCLAHVVARIGQYGALCVLACTCRRWQLLVYRDHKGWEARCRADWGIVEAHPQLIPRLETGLLWAETATPQSVCSWQAGLQQGPSIPIHAATHHTAVSTEETSQYMQASLPGVSITQLRSTAVAPQSSAHASQSSTQQNSVGKIQSPRVSGHGGACGSDAPAAGVAWAEVWPEVISPRSRQHSNNGAARSASSSGAGVTSDSTCAGAAATNNSAFPIKQPLPLPRLFSLQGKQHGSAAFNGYVPPGLHGSGRLSSPIKPHTSRRSSKSAVSNGSDEDVPGDAVPVSSLWRLIYRDRAQGWHLVEQTLTWLRDHGNPPAVTGSMHRFQLQLALRYMVLGTGQPHDTARRQVILGLDGLKSLLALLHNDAMVVVEMAANILANMMVYHPDTKLLVLVGSRLGKLFGDRLDFSSGPLLGAMQACCRALVTLWVEPPTPEVRVLNAMNQIACPRVPAGRACSWLLQEYSLRGESTALIRLTLTFQPQHNATWSLHGTGFDHSYEFPEEFEVQGEVVMCADGQQKWTWQRCCITTQHTLLYSGYNDAYGSYGVYTSRQASNALAIVLASQGRQPRTYRMSLVADA